MDKTITFKGIYIKKLGNTITIEDILSKNHIDILLAKDKTFNLEIGCMYEFVVGKDKDNNLWLNERIKIILCTREELGLEDEFNFVVPNHPEHVRTFHTDKRTALMTAIDYHKGKGKSYTEEQVIHTAKKFFRELNSNYEKGGVAL